MNAPAPVTTPTQCENCGTALQGHYCHVCGQRAHNPLHHFSHAVEEVFESLWHLDGRIFRTLRDLFVPGKVAANYLAGHRVRYIAPLRLFVILSLITFFVGKLTLHFDIDNRGTAADESAQGNITINGNQVSAASEYANAKTVDEVLALYAESMGELAEARQDPTGRWVMAAVNDTAQNEIRAAAQRRLRELGATPEQLRKLDIADTAADTAATPHAKPQGFLERWTEKKLKRIEANSKLAREDPDALIRLILGAVPGALFLLVPLFALCLKLAYVGSGRGFLEHLVVALYSHAFLLLTLLSIFCLVGLLSLSGLPGWLKVIAITANAIIPFAAMLYLLWMQKRVYGEGWLMTLLKYVALGTVYWLLLSFGIIYALFAGLSS